MKKLFKMALVVIALVNILTPTARGMEGSIAEAEQDAELTTGERLQLGGYLGKKLIGAMPGVAAEMARDTRTSVRDLFARPQDSTVRTLLAAIEASNGPGIAEDDMQRTRLVEQIKTAINKLGGPLTKPKISRDLCRNLHETDCLRDDKQRSYRTQSPITLAITYGTDWLVAEILNSFDIRGPVLNDLLYRALISQISPAAKIRLLVDRGADVNPQATC